jgi:hypothetical protein
MLMLNKFEILEVCGGFFSYSASGTSERRCECCCRQHRTENITTNSLPKGWHMLNGEKYEDIVIGDTYGMEECLKVCTTMMDGNLFRSCMPIKDE